MRVALRTTIGLVLLAGCMAWAQEPQPLTSDDQAAIIEQISNALLETYVFPEDAEAMAQHLGEQLESGAYDEMSDVSTFCRQLTKDLHSVRRDLHLHVDRARPRPAQPSAEEQAKQRKQRQERMRRFNYGFRKLEMLEGNVGYLRFDGFIDAGNGGATAVAVMGFLANADAIIFDLRYNGGGSPSMIQLISSYLFEEPTHLNSFYIRKSDSMKQFWTQSHIQGERMTEVPVFVLTSDRTFSAAEEFTYNLKNLERATIVGETTGGGAHPVERFNVEGYPVSVSLPFGRAINPITETNWEGTGIEPHIQVEADQALDTAHQKALEMIAEATDDPVRKQELELSSARVRARVDPLVLDEADMQAYAGDFGPHKVSVIDGNLVLFQGGEMQLRMVPIGNDRFLIEDVEGVLVSFERNEAGEVIAAVGHSAGMEERYSRAP